MKPQLEYLFIITTLFFCSYISAQAKGMNNDLFPNTIWEVEQTSTGFNFHTYARQKVIGNLAHQISINARLNSQHKIFDYWSIYFPKHTSQHHDGYVFFKKNGTINSPKYPLKLHCDKLFEDCKYSFHATENPEPNWLQENLLQNTSIVIGYVFNDQALQIEKTLSGIKHIYDQLYGTNFSTEDAEFLSKLYGNLTTRPIDIRISETGLLYANNKLIDNNIEINKVASIIGEKPEFYYVEKSGTSSIKEKSDYYIFPSFGIYLVDNYFKDSKERRIWFCLKECNEKIYPVFPMLSFSGRFFVKEKQIDPSSKDEWSAYIPKKNNKIAIIDDVDIADINAHSILIAYDQNKQFVRELSYEAKQHYQPLAKIYEQAEISPNESIAFTDKTISLGDFNLISNPSFDEINKLMGGTDDIEVAIYGVIYHYKNNGIDIVVNKESKRVSKIIFNTQKHALGRIKILGKTLPAKDKLFRSDIPLDGFEHNIESKSEYREMYSVGNGTLQFIFSSKDGSLYQISYDFIYEDNKEIDQLKKQLLKALESAYQKSK